MEDFIAFTENEIICIEIKISKSDFLRDFKTKDKHKSSPNHDKFYFCVSEEIAAFVDEFVRENYPSYGVLVATSDGIKSIKQAKKVVPSYKRNFRSLVLRMSSELANIRVKEFKKENK